MFTPTAYRLVVATAARTTSPRRWTRSCGSNGVAALTGLHDATAASTFGLISPSKGLEADITAVARLADEVPDLLYAIARTTVFLTSYRSAEQISSGALTLALAAGVPAVSTAYPYATDMLADGAGITVPVGDDEAFTSALRTILTEPGRQDAAATAARTIGDHLGWPIVAVHLADVVRTATDRPATPAPRQQAQRPPLLQAA